MIFEVNDKVQCILADWTSVQLEIDPTCPVCPLEEGVTYTVAFVGGYRGVNPEGRDGWTPVLELAEIPHRVFASSRFRKLPEIGHESELVEALSS